jgi:hypothetical protein
MDPRRDATHLGEHTSPLIRCQRHAVTCDAWHAFGHGERRRVVCRREVCRQQTRDRQSGLPAALARPDFLGQVVRRVGRESGDTSAPIFEVYHIDRMT